MRRLFLSSKSIYSMAGTLSIAVILSVSSMVFSQKPTAIATGGQCRWKLQQCTNGTWRSECLADGQEQLCICGMVNRPCFP